MDLIKVTPDKEKVNSILQMVILIEERIKIQSPEKMSALIIADYYEIIKELTTAILLIDGYKTLSHKDLVAYLEEKISGLSTEEIYLIDQLRILRNRVAYEGFLINSSYLHKNEISYKQIINKLRQIIKQRIS